MEHNLMSLFLDFRLFHIVQIHCIWHEQTCMSHLLKLHQVKIMLKM